MNVFISIRARECLYNIEISFSFIRQSFRKCLQLYFIKDNCQRIICVYIDMECFQLPGRLHSIYKAREDKISFGIDTDRLLSNLPEPE